MKIPLPEGQVVDEDNGIWVGDFIWEDFNQDSVINEEDRQYLGSPLPKFTYGIGNTFSYKNFDLNIFLTGSYGNKVMNFLGLTIDNPNNTGITKRAATRYAKLGLVDPEGPSDESVLLPIWRWQYGSGTPFINLTETIETPLLFNAWRSLYVVVTQADYAALNLDKVLEQVYLKNR